MNMYDDNTATRDAAVLLEFQEPDQITGLPGPPGYSASQPNNSNAESDPNVLSSKASIFSVHYYQEFFNVNTEDVLRKVRFSLLPNMSKNYFEENIKSKPDLYGPVWICITLAFTIAIGSNLVDYINSNSLEWKYEFHVITKASLIVFSYAWIIPLILWSLIKWYLASQMFVSAVELICIYGYCLVVYIPLSLLWIVHFHYLQLIFMILAISTSGVVLVSAIEPMLSNKNYAVVGGVIILHIFFSLIVFFSFFYVK